jgi:glucose-6-phosphate 1-dehydrogenase
MTTSVVIFGISGDLARRKLVPALFTLYCKGRLPDDIRIIGFARSDYSDNACRLHMWEGAQELGELSTRDADWARFSERVFFVRGDLNDPEALGRLRERLEGFEEGATEANRLYYLSIAPSLYGTAVTNLGQAGLASQEKGWARVVVEKPFGYDGASATALDETIHKVFDESQVYRIDHYLGKETVQNLLVFRFANAIFEPMWNRNHVAQVQITAAESVGLEGRGSYYESSGVLRDMVQNHLLQLLTMVAMEPPSSMEATALRNEKIKVLQAVRGWDSDDIAKDVVTAQYKGYTDEPGVDPDSRTPTYTAMRVFVDNWRWQGVPFYLRSGKALAEKTSEIVVQFKEPPHRLFEEVHTGDMEPNTLGICLQPHEGVHLRFQVKVPDAGTDTHPKDMAFHYESEFKDMGIPEAYERLLQDAVNGDPSLFIRSDQIAASWQIVDPVLQALESPDKQLPVASYDPGSWGPAEADRLLAENGHKWVRVCVEH